MIHHYYQFNKIQFNSVVFEVCMYMFLIAAAAAATD